MNPNFRIFPFSFCKKYFGVLLFLIFSSAASGQFKHATGLERSNWSLNQLKKIFETANFYNAKVHIPDSIDLSDKFPPPLSQEDEGSCAEWAAIYGARSYLEAKNHPGYTYYHSDGNLNYNKMFNPGFIYNLIIQSRNSESQDRCHWGTAINEAFNTLQTYGAPTFAECAYDPHGCMNPLPNDVVQKAAAHKMEIFTRDVPKDRFSYYLSRGCPIVISAAINRDFDQLHCNNENCVWNTFSSDNDRSFHGLVIVGYNNRTHLYKVQNSWGPGFGYKGYFYMTYDHMNDDNVCLESYAIDDLASKPYAPPYNLSNIDDPSYITEGYKGRANIGQGYKFGSLIVWISQYEPSSQKILVNFAENTVDNNFHSILVYEGETKSIYHGAEQISFSYLKDENGQIDYVLKVRKYLNPDLERLITRYKHDYEKELAGEIKKLASESNKDRVGEIKSLIKELENKLKLTE